MSSYDRYNRLRENGDVKPMPFIKLKIKNTDRYEPYKEGFTRLDILSYKHYGDPNYDWLIKLANSNLGSMGYDYVDGSIIRIPFPLEVSLDEYNNEMTKYNHYYGF